MKRFNQFYVVGNGRIEHNQLLLETSGRLDYILRFDLTKNMLEGLTKVVGRIGAVYGVHNDSSHYIVRLLEPKKGLWQAIIRQRTDSQLSFGRIVEDYPGYLDLGEIREGIEEER